MTKHRVLSIKKLVFAVPWDLFVRYFEGLAPAARPNDWAFLNPGMMEEFLQNPENEGASAIAEDFNRINDLCAKGAYLLYRALENYSIDRGDGDRDENPLVLSMRLFLDDRVAFEYAWSLYLLFSGTTKTWEFIFPAGPLSAPDDRIDLLRASLQGWFQNHHEGQQCEIKRFFDGDGLVIRITRGSTIRTVARWRENEVTFEAFRPASEDIIVYEPERSRLLVKTRLRRDREFYVHQFAEYIAQDPELGDRALATKIFSLAPFQNDSFDYRGDGVITAVSLVEIVVALGDLSDQTVVIRGTDVRSSLDSEVGGVPLRTADWLRVALRFELKLETRRKPHTVTIHIEPPGCSDLTEKSYSNLVEGHLRREHVKLI